MPAQVDAHELEVKVKAMYRDVAERPRGEYHFQLGRSLAERLGYPPEALDSIPAGAVESFAGVGYFFDLAELSEGERVVDLGSGSGMDVFFAALGVGPAGHVTGVDFTAEQLAKARRLTAEAGFEQVEFVEAPIERVPLPDQCCDCVISNGVFNLAPDKRAVFAEVARLLRPGGRMAIADIVSEQQLKDSIVCDADLWASCIGGAAQHDAYRDAIESAGMVVERTKVNTYEFISERARNASDKYGVKSIALVAHKEHSASTAT
jgi:arsenite methyltransferase